MFSHHALLECCVVADAEKRKKTPATCNAAKPYTRREPASEPGPPLHALTETLAWQPQRDGCLDLDDSGLAVDDNWLPVMAHKLALPVVRVVKLAEPGLLERTVGQLEKMARCPGRLY